MDIDAIFQGIATATATITGLRTYPKPPDSINPPVLAPMDFDISYHQTFGSGLNAVPVTVGVFTSRGDTDAGRDLLFGYLSASGATSVKAALEADKTLGGACSTLVVDGVTGAMRLYEIAGVQYLGAEINMRVWAT